MNRPKAFIIFFVARSGSTHLLYRLRSHPQVDARAEIFGGATLPEGEEQTGDNQIKFVRKFFRPFKLDTRHENGKARGFKIQMLFRDPHLKQAGRLASVLQEYDFAPIILRRQNILKQQISSMNARRLMEYSKKTSGTALQHMFVDKSTAFEGFDPNRLYINPSNLIQLLENTAENYRILRQLEAKFETKLQIEYEKDLQQREKETMARIFEFIGVDPFDLPEQTELAKITPDDLTQVIENYDEVRLALSGTRWEQYLESGA